MKFPIQTLIAGVKKLVAEYDRTDDHDPTHNGVSAHDCIRCHLLEAIGIDSTREATRCCSAPIEYEQISGTRVYTIRNGKRIYKTHCAHCKSPSPTMRPGAPQVQDESSR